MMKYIIVTQEDPFYIRLFFEEFLALRQKGSLPGKLESVVVLPAFNESRTALVKRLYELYGPVDFSRLLGQYGVAKAKRILSRVGLSKEISDIGDICRLNGVHVQEIANVNAPEFVSWVKDNGIDIIISISAPQIFRKKLLEAPRLARINIHNGRLPDYRGMLPNFWQLYNGETDSTMTVHTMGERLDTGSVLAETRTPISPGMSLDALIRETKRKSAHVLEKILHDYEAGEVTPIRTIELDKGSYYSFPKRRHATKVRRAGHSLL